MRITDEDIEAYYTELDDFNRDGVFYVVEQIAQREGINPQDDDATWAIHKAIEERQAIYLLESLGYDVQPPERG